MSQVVLGKTNYFSKPDFFLGICEDNKDPCNSNRIKVRIVGLHPENGCNVVKTEDLPWALVMMPPDTFHGNNSGRTVNIQKGTFCIGMFLDEDNQNPVILGIIPQRDLKLSDLKNLKDIVERMKKNSEYDCENSFTRLSNNETRSQLNDPLKRETIPEPNNNPTGTNSRNEQENFLATSSRSISISRENTNPDNTTVSDAQIVDEASNTYYSLADGRRSYSMCEGIDRSLADVSNMFRSFGHKINKLEIVDVGNFLEKNSFISNNKLFGSQSRISEAKQYKFVERSTLNQDAFKFKSIDANVGWGGYIKNGNFTEGGNERNPTGTLSGKLKDMIGFNKLTGEVQDLNKILKEYSSMIKSSLNGFIDFLKKQIMEQVKKLFEKLIPATVRKDEFSTKQTVDMQDIILKLIQCAIEGLFNMLLGFIEDFLFDKLFGCLEDIINGLFGLIDSILGNLMSLIEGLFGAIEGLLGSLDGLAGLLGGFSCNEFIDQLIDFLCSLLGGNSSHQADFINPRNGSLKNSIENKGVGLLPKDKRPRGIGGNVEIA